MDDEPEDEAPSRKAPQRKRRDPNQPLPKPHKRKGVLLKLLVGGATAVLLLWVSLYSAQLGRAPWAWSGEDFAGFLTFSRAQVDEARKQVEAVDWEALASKITERTRELWDKVPDLEARLEAKLAELRGQGQGGGAAPTPAEGEASPPPTAVAPGSARLEQGCLAFREGIRHYRKSMDSQVELKQAKARFQEAQDHFGAAYQEAEQAGDAEAQAEAEGYLMEVQTYLQDCSKRETL